MAFILKKTNDFIVEVSVSTPLDDKVVEWKFKAKFKVLTGDDVKAGQGSILEHGLISVEGVNAEEGLSDSDILALVKSRPDTSAALVRAYNENLSKKNRGSSFI